VTISTNGNESSSSNKEKYICLALCYSNPICADCLVVISNWNEYISIYYVSTNNKWAGIAQSVERLATGWTVRGSNPTGEARFSAPVQTVLESHLTTHKMGTGSFPGVKRPRRGVDHQPPSSAEVKERVEV
jgi:hypothetical protein